MTCKECRHWEQCVLPDGTTRYYGTENACGNVHSLCKWFISKTDAAQQKWIPVTERLPDAKKVIGGEEYIKNVAVRVKELACERIAFYDDEEKCWFDTDFLPIAGYVMYWCELPEWDLPQPPKEGK